MRSARGTVWCSCAAVVTALSAWAAPEPEEPADRLSPELQIFVNVQDELSRSCIYSLSPRDITIGALKALSKNLGGHYAHYFKPTLATEPGFASADYRDTLEAIAADPEAVKSGWTVKKLVERSLNAYCQTLDAYDLYTEEEVWQRLEAAKHPEYVGIGLTIRRTPAGFFGVPFNGSAADLAGVRTGDELLEIDGVNARTYSLLEVSERLAGLPGSLIKLTVRHRDGKTERLEAKRQKIVSTPIAVDQTGDTTRISFVRINPQGVVELKKALQNLGPGHDLTLDFRGCPGGDLESAIKIAELFLPEKTPIARLEFVRERQAFLSQNRAPYRPRRLRLLQDEGTASGAEIIIAALLGYPPLRAVSMGEKTFGKGVTTQDIRYPRGGVLRETVSRIYGPHDEFWDGSGLSPTSDAKP